MAVIVIAIVRIIAPPGICKRSTEEKPVIVKSTVVEPAIVKSIAVEPAPVKPTGVEPAPMKPTAPAVETPAAAPAMRPSVGEFWLA